MAVLVVAAFTLAGLPAAGQQIIFNENFDGGYSGAFGTSSYSGGSPTATAKTVLSSGGNPNGCFQVTMTTTTANDVFAGQVQLETVAGATDLNPSDYVLSFDAYGSQAANIQLLIQTWPQDYFGGTGPVVNATVNDQLTSAYVWQTFKLNLGTVTTASPIGGTWQLSFQVKIPAQRAGLWARASIGGRCSAALLPEPQYIRISLCFSTLPE